MWYSLKAQAQCLSKYNTSVQIYSHLLTKVQCLNSSHIDGVSESKNFIMNNRCNLVTSIHIEELFNIRSSSETSSPAKTYIANHLHQNILSCNLWWLLCKQWPPHFVMIYGVHSPICKSLSKYSSDKSSDKYSKMHNFVTEKCTHWHISITKWCIVGYGVGAFADLCYRSNLKT